MPYHTTVPARRGLHQGGAPADGGRVLCSPQRRGHRGAAPVVCAQRGQRQQQVLIGGVTA